MQRPADKQEIRTQCRKQPAKQSQQPCRLKGTLPCQRGSWDNCGTTFGGRKIKRRAGRTVSVIASANAQRERPGLRCATWWPSASNPSSGHRDDSCKSHAREPQRTRKTALRTYNRPAEFHGLARFPRSHNAFGLPVRPRIISQARHNACC